LPDGQIDRFKRFARVRTPPATPFDLRSTHLPENSAQLMRLVAMHNKLPHATWTYAMLVTIKDQKECLGAQRRSGTYTLPLLSIKAKAKIANF
jgi:hypothetical protein